MNKKINTLDVVSNNKPRVLLFDLETAPNFHANLGSILCFGYKWLDDPKIHCIHVGMWPTTYKKNPFDDKKLLIEASKIILQADVTVAHYGDKFDKPYLMTRLMKHNLDNVAAFLSLSKQIDTWRLAYNNLKLSSNKLDNIAKFFGLESKDKMDWNDWLDVMKSDPKAIIKMEKYCKKDVLVLEQVYLKLRPLYGGHPNMGINIDRDACPTCGSMHTNSRGYYYAQRQKYRKIQCLDCGHWYRNSKAEKALTT